MEVSKINLLFILDYSVKKKKVLWNIYDMQGRKKVQLT